MKFSIIFYFFIILILVKTQNLEVAVKSGWNPVTSLCKLNCGWFSRCSLTKDTTKLSDCDSKSHQCSTLCIENPNCTHYLWS